MACDLKVKGGQQKNANREKAEFIEPEETPSEVSHTHDAENIDELPDITYVATNHCM